VADILYERRWWDAVRAADRHHPDGHTEGVSPGLLPDPRDGGAGKWVVRELHRPEDDRPSAVLAVRGLADAAAEMWGAVAALCTPVEVQFAA